MNIKQMIVAMLVVVGVMSVSIAQADPRPTKPVTTRLKVKQILPVFKPNLVARDLGWSGEFCNRSKCFREFANLGFNKATCRFSVRVVNLGSGAAGRFRVKLEYRDWKDTSRTTTVVVSAGLKRKGQFGSSKLVYFNAPYYKLNQYFKVTVDSLSQVSETSETDNIAYYRTTY